MNVKESIYYVTFLGEYLTITHACNYNAWEVNKGKLLDKPEVSSQKKKKEKVNTKSCNIVLFPLIFMVDSTSNYINEIHYKYGRVNTMLLYFEST